MKNYAKALTIAGSDSGGGAGIQADLKTFSALSCYGMSAITALTAQNTQGVQAIQDIPATFVTQQLSSVLTDIGADAIKIGMLFSEEVIVAVVAELKNYVAIPVVVDPVMVAKSGNWLLQEEAVNQLRTVLLPLTTLLTPNLLEAELLSQQAITDRAAMQQAAKTLSEQGPQAVLIKGGHGSEVDSVDCLYLREEKEWHWFAAPRIATPNTHGTGCTLSAAITACLARGYPLLDAISTAKKYLTGALTAGSQYSLGAGHGPVHHFYQFWG